MSELRHFCCFPLNIQSKKPWVVSWNSGEGIQLIWKNSKFSMMGYFPEYFSVIPLCTQNMAATAQKYIKPHLMLLLCFSNEGHPACIDIWKSENPGHSCRLGMLCILVLIFLKRALACFKYVLSKGRLPKKINLIFGLLAQTRGEGSRGVQRAQFC